MMKLWSLTVKLWLLTVKLPLSTFRRSSVLPAYKLARLFIGSAIAVLKSPTLQTGRRLRSKSQGRLPPPFRTAAV